MSNKKQKLELTWIGKDKQPVLEPRILIENPEFSYPAEKPPNPLKGEQETPNPLKGGFSRVKSSIVFYLITFDSYISIHLVDVKAA